jgi:superfamily II DNA or RNA helicase
MKMTNAKYRFGCTGTLPDGALEDLNIKSYIGPVIKEYGTEYLRERGYVSSCTIHQIELNYKKKVSKKETFDSVKSELFPNVFRLNCIKDQILKIKENVKLLLVDRVEEGGEVLKNFFEICPELKDHEIVFISGRVKKSEREE